MNVELQRNAGPNPMTGEQFRSFQEKRPENERWELIAGFAMMMPPPKLAHNVIASNLERLLKAALTDHDPTRLAIQRAGIDLPGVDDYKPEPDVVVIDAEFEATQRYVDRVYLAAEIVSSTDDEVVPESGQRKIEEKRGIYLQHAPCEAVLVIEQERMEVRVDVRTGGGWQPQQKLGGEDVLHLPAFGLRCAVSELYENTPLKPKPNKRHTV